MRESLRLYRVLFVIVFSLVFIGFTSTNVNADDFTPNEGYENYEDSYSDESYDESYDDDYSDESYDDSYEDSYSDESYDDSYSDESYDDYNDSYDDDSYDSGDTDNSEIGMDEIPDVSYDSPDKTNGNAVSSVASERSFENDTIAARMKGNAKKREVSVTGTILWSIFLMLLLVVVIAAISGGIANYKEEKRRKNNGRPKIIISDGYIRGSYEVRPRNAPNAKPNERIESLDELNKKGEYD